MSPRTYPKTASFLHADGKGKRDIADERGQKWRRSGVLEFDPEDLEDEDLRRRLIDYANGQYGRRGAPQ